MGEESPRVEAVSRGDGAEDAADVVGGSDGGAGGEEGAAGEGGMTPEEGEEEGKAIGVSAVAAREGDGTGLSARVVFSEVEKGGEGVGKASWVRGRYGDVVWGVVPYEEGSC